MNTAKQLCHKLPLRATSMWPVWRTHAFCDTGSVWRHPLCHTAAGTLSRYPPCRRTLSPGRSVWWRLRRRHRGANRRSLYAGRPQLTSQTVPDITIIINCCRLMARKPHRCSQQLNEVENFDSMADICYTYCTRCLPDTVQSHIQNTIWYDMLF